MTGRRRYRTMFAGATMCACALLAMSAGCSSGTAHDDPAQKPAGADAEGSPPVDLSFSQLSSQVGTNQGLLRVVNVGPADLTVTGVGIDWSGYGPRFVQSKDTLLPPERTVDFPINLPDPDCDAGSGELRGVVELGGTTISQALEQSGEALLRRVRSQACEQQFVEDRVEIGYDDAWHTTGAGDGTSVVGHLLLERRDSAAPIRLTNVVGSVLYDLVLPGRSELPPSASAARLPLQIVPGNRCDEHARSQVTAPFAFRLTLRIGDDVVSIPIPPPAEVQVQVTELLEAACR
jgi:hypothetical protein